MKTYRFIVYLTAFLLVSLMSQTALAQRPESVKENLVISAVNKFNAGNLADARTILNQAIEKDSACDAAWYYLALVSLEEKDLETAETCLRRAVEIDPQNFWYRCRFL